MSYTIYVFLFLTLLTVTQPQCTETTSAHNARTTHAPHASPATTSLNQHASNATLSA